MSRPISSTNTVTINRDQAPDQDALNELKTFQRGLGKNDRFVTSCSGNTTIYTKLTESAAEKFNRKLDNFGKSVKSAWSHVSDLFSVKSQGTGSEATKNVKDTTTQKSPSSISVKQFNLDITRITNTCNTPVLDDLTDQRDNLKDLGRMICEMNTSYSLDFFSTGSQSLEKVEKEFSAFAQFAQAQGRGESVTHPNRDAINFANRWVAIPPSEHKEMKARFGESYLTIFNAALALSNFALLSPFQKS